jgi:hypothetical protein
VPFDEGRRASSVKPVGWGRVEAVEVHLKADMRGAVVAQHRRVLKPVPDCPRADEIVYVRGAEGKDLQTGELNM